MKISILVVNLNNLQYTKQCVLDLLEQDEGFYLRLVDQNSTEIGTSEFLESIKNLRIKKKFRIDVLKNQSNIALNSLWNDFVEQTTTPYICFLNNDVRICPNFISSAIKIFELCPDVSFVNHVTNNRNYTEWSTVLKYEIIQNPYRQGWDPIFRRSSYHPIPKGLKFFYGDDYIYSKAYSDGFKGAYVLNSPMIHFERSTTIEKGGQRDCSEDGSVFYSLDLEFKDLNFVENFSKWKPEFITLEKK